ncbi:MAG: hypothetical protein ACOX6T_22680, partial [Myxococcales bacterium]
MSTQPRAMKTVEALLAKGVDIPNPLTLDIGPEVDPARISSDGVKLYPGCRIYGAKTVISAGVKLGAEGPQTIDDCRLGPNVELKGGYAAKSVFLDGANLSLGHHVREGSILEEEAGGAHCVGLKQTILFPFVTLGSLINFCDCMMAGGTSRSDHSEVGSSYIHFNFTPSGDKSTPSLFGDVARGVMLRERPIFLGGQGGAVGPVTVGYGSVVAAGGVLRDDVPEGKLVMTGALPARQTPFVPSTYRAAYRIVAKNVAYIAGLRALGEWYARARAPFFAAQELGPLVLEGALEALESAKKERRKRLEAMAAKVSPDDEDRALLRERIGEVCDALLKAPLRTPVPEKLLATLEKAAAGGAKYIAAIKALADDEVAAGTAWLDGIIGELYAGAVERLPALG